jgi:predicted metalloprotease
MADRELLAADSSGGPEAASGYADGHRIPNRRPTVPLAARPATRPALRTVAVAVAAVLAAGCGVVIGPDDTRSEPTQQAESLATDERRAIEITDRFWRETFPDQFGRSYRPPRVEGGYTGESGPACGGQPSVPFNAFYCPSADFLAWDEQLMADGYSRIGDAWVYLIIAHEWAHAIQARLQRDQVSVAAELQADCLAGASLFGAAERGWVDLERGDTQELSQTLAAVADDYPWTDESDHGNAQQRTAAFSDGAENGVGACTS